MESRKPSVDLGKELTCSICTELLYQPLTLLDCLHTYCGACLKEWFKFQAAKAARAPVPPTPDTVIFSCPSCRSRVRDTKHNATVVTLLDMYIAANPTRDRTDDDKQEMAAKYKPGDQVLPKVKVRERTGEERRADEEDQRLVDEVRQISLREAVAAGGGGGSSSSSSSQSTRPRYRGDSRSGDERQRSSRRHESESNHRQPGEEGRQRQTENGGHGRERLHSDARRPRADSHSRHVEHQSSLRSLIGSEMSDREIEREIEDFARQIQEEGLLDGLDLDNIDLKGTVPTGTGQEKQRQRQDPCHATAGRGRPRREASSGQQAPQPVPDALTIEKWHRGCC
ncbi:E3 ubiquitin-protein ligase CHFR [Escovopsis weberi]|uniref:E3 ubiquitin-protein ligase CHFR n=1 Tax=Escovopsis weberi TaxID=150374 RepID=A0A0M8N1J7_ESCWE|nr:E3 ubiquitin-protein ligase CHFR [Escovopsis weberi]